MSINRYLMYGVPNQSNPGACRPKTVKYTAQTNGVGFDTFDLTIPIDNGVIDQIQSVFIDASATTAPVSVTCNITGHKVVCVAGSQGWFPILSPNPPVFTISCLSTSPNATLFFCNMAMPAGVWTT